MFEHACRLGAEGIVSKRRTSRYRSGRTSTWIKIKNPAAPAARRVIEEDWGRRRATYPSFWDCDGVIQFELIASKKR